MYSLRRPFKFLYLLWRQIYFFLNGMSYWKYWYCMYCRYYKQYEQESWDWYLHRTLTRASCSSLLSCSLPSSEWAAKHGSFFSSAFCKSTVFANQMSNLVIILILRGIWLNARTLAVFFLLLLIRIDDSAFLLQHPSLWFFTPLFLKYIFLVLILLLILISSPDLPPPSNLVIVRVWEVGTGTTRLGWPLRYFPCLWYFKRYLKRYCKFLFSFKCYIT